MTSASTPVAVLQAKSALRFEENLIYSEDKIESNIEIKEDSETSKLNNTLNSTKINEKLKPIQLVREILDSQEVLSKYKNKEEEKKLKEKWSYPLNDPAVISRILGISTRLTNVVKDKDKVLETLRNPIAENSIPWRKDRQGDLVDSFHFLKQLSKNKETNESNSAWIENQDWELFANKDLPSIETKILKLEAEIASEQKECKIIKGFAE